MIELTNSEKVARLLKENISSNDAEEFWVLALNPRCQLIQAKMLFKGTVDQCFYHPRDIFRFAVIHNASYIIVGHSHPSGSMEPSLQDLKITKELSKLCKLMGIPLLDHVIVIKGEDGFFSFKQKFLLTTKLLS